MNPPNLFQKLAIASVAGASLAVPMKAEAAYFMLDDFNVTETRRANIGFPNPNPDVSKTVIGGDIWPEDWDRVEMGITNVAGDQGQAVLCSNCEAFEMLSGAGDSQNIAYIDYSGLEFDLSIYDGWMVSYAADLSGGDLRLIANGMVVAEAIDLPDTNMTSSPEELVPLKLDWVVPDEDLVVTELRIEIDGTGVGNLDFTVDHNKVPEPGTMLGLLAIGGLGLGMKRKRS